MHAAYIELETQTPREIRGIYHACIKILTNQISSYEVVKSFSIQGLITSYLRDPIVVTNTVI